MTVYVLKSSQFSARVEWRLFQKRILRQMLASEPPGSITSSAIPLDADLELIRTE
jgi:hypothetical protein